MSICLKLLPGKTKRRGYEEIRKYMKIAAQKEVTILAVRIGRHPDHEVRLRTRPDKLHKLRISQGLVELTGAEENVFTPNSYKELVN